MLTKSICATASHFVSVAILLTCAGCGSGTGQGSTVLPPTPPPPPSFSNPSIIWPGDVQVSSGLGDHGIGTSGTPGIAIVPDGAGGAMFAWEDDAAAVIRSQHIDSSGNRIWQAAGVLPAAVSAYQASPRAVSDGSGGMIVVWVDGRAGFCDEGFKGNCDIYAQRIDASGALLWNSLGVPIVTAPENQGISGIAMVGDGAGGAILAWEDARPNCCKIFAQRIQGNGQVAWPTDGVRVSPEPTIVIGSIGAPQIASDGNGGAIISWWNYQYSDPNQFQTVSAQRMDANGNAMWPPTGVTVSGISGGPTSGQQRSYALTPDGGGGAIFAGTFNDQTGAGVLFAQRVAGTGQVAWSSPGVQLYSAAAHLLYATITSDGSSGAIVVWNDCVMQGVNCSILTQRVDPSGRLLWAVSGISITSTPNRKAGPIALSDGTGGAVVAWNDCPNVTDYTQCVQGIDLYSQRIDPAGHGLWQPNGFPVSTAPDNQGVLTGGETSGIVLSMDSSGNMFYGWPDGRVNHNCAFLQFPSRCDLFAQRLH